MGTSWRLSPREVLIIAKALSDLSGTTHLDCSCSCSKLTNEEIADLAARFAGAACIKNKCKCQAKSNCNRRDCC